MPKEPDPRSLNLIKKLIQYIWDHLSKLYKYYTGKSDDLYLALRELKLKSQRLSREEKDILINFLKFGNKEVKDYMIHRTDISALSVKSSIGEINKAIAEKSHTRTPIYEENLDKILGFVHLKDLYKVVVSGKKSSVKDVMRKHLITTPPTNLIDLLVAMKRKRTHIAVVVDEYGSTEGIITIEDIVEEIVGEIEDEHDHQVEVSHDYDQISDDIIITNARVEVRVIEKALGASLKSEDENVDTIGGLVMMRSGHVPKRGEVIHIFENIEAEVLSSSARYIKRLKIIRGEDFEK
jgi:CBS domain containing-hemolysin-like protein